MTRDEKIATAVRLREAGLSSRDIGRYLGVTGSCVLNWLHPERAKEYARRGNADSTRKRAWDERNRKRCACGAWMSAKSALKTGGPTVCRDCHREQVALKRVWREQDIYEMWHAGFTLLGIAFELGATKESVAVTINRMRRDGWDMPYRHRGYTTFPHLAPAGAEVDEGRAAA